MSHAPTSKARNAWAASFFPREHETTHPAGFPTDPHTTWMGATSLHLGLVAEAVPAWLDLETERVVRAIRWQPELDGHTWSLAIFSTSPDHELVPPYSGQPPVGIRSHYNPIACHTDGGIARWDPRHIPQLFDPHRLWLGFHLVVHELTPECVPMDLDVLPVTSFFSWNSPGNPEKGGHWRRNLLIKLFCLRATAEASLERAIQDLKRRSATPMDWSKLFLPWYDTEDERTALRWQSWREGRDSLGRTLLYTAEIKAMKRWVNSLEPGPTALAPHCVHPTRSDLMGVWGATITQTSEWSSLRQGGVPVYVVSEIPPDHPLWPHTKPGNIDGDERYRHNAFDAEHKRINPFWRFRVNSFAILEPLENVPHCTRIPLLHRPPRLQRRSKHPSDSHLLTWTTYIFEDAEVTRDWTGKWDAESYWAMRKKYDDRKHFGFVPPAHRVLSVRADPHPIFQAMPKARDAGITHIQERTLHPESNVWWAKKLGSDAKKRVANLSLYVFEYPHERITIYSDHPFPGRDPRLGLRVNEAESSVPPMWIDLRHYFIHSARRLDSKPDNRHPPDYTWKATCNVSLSNDAGPTRTVRGGHSYHPYREQRDVATPNTGQLVVLDFPILLPPLGPMAPVYRRVAPSSLHTTDSQPLALFEDGNHVESIGASISTSVHDNTCLTERSDVTAPTLLQQRHTLQGQIERRLFNPIRGTELRSDSLIPWVIPNSNHVLCWPIRVANLHGSVRAEAVLSTISQLLPTAGVIAFAFYSEVDTTHTLDVGMRCAEDALFLWLCLHGVMVGDRILEVYPLTCMVGGGFAINKSWDTQQPLPERGSIVMGLMDFVRRVEPPSSHAKSALDMLLADLGTSGSSATMSTQQLPAWVATQVNVISTLDALLSYEGEKGTFQDVSFGKDKTPTIGTWKLSFFYMGTPRFTSSMPAPSNNVAPTGRLVTNQGLARTDRTRPAQSPDGPNLFVQERKGLKRAIAKQMNEIAACWKGFVLPRFDYSRQGRGGDRNAALSQFYKELWDWQDLCLEIASAFREESPTDYDWSPFDDAFGSLAQIGSVCGPEYQECLDLWQKRSGVGDV